MNYRGKWYCSKSFLHTAFHYQLIDALKELVNHRYRKSEELHISTCQRHTQTAAHFSHLWRKGRRNGSKCIYLRKTAHFETGLSWTTGYRNFMRSQTMTTSITIETTDNSKDMHEHPPLARLFRTASFFCTR